MAITSAITYYMANNICQKISIGFKKCDNNICHIQHSRSWSKNIEKLYNIDIHVNFGKNYNQNYLE